LPGGERVKGKRRGYLGKILIKHCEITNIFSQWDLLKPKDKLVTNREIMVTGFNPNNPDLIKILRKYWYIMIIALTILAKHHGGPK
jgi:hypothetical protein